ncbi:MAG: M48 family metalloprotease [Acidobacteria bacterium]|nr:M48 family metalloprotease [Acidobacteriota bacterium]
MKFTVAFLTGCLAVAVTTPAAAQFGRLGKALGKAADMQQDLSFSDEEEAVLGSEISAKLREKYGVVQDKAVHKYVTLVGTLLASESSRPGLKWTFVVLDTDGINAFAAPGGYVHITRGALGLIQNEAELADVLAHEIGHVTAKHTIKAIQKSKLVGLGAKATRKDVLSQAADRGYEMLLENNFDRGDEMDADKTGVTLANGAGYAPAGLGAFLTRLAERNKNLKDRSGLFASHPDTKARIDALGKVIGAGKLTAAATVQGRYGQSISYKPTPVAAVSGDAGDGAKTAEGTGGTLGLTGLAGLGREKSGGQTVSSAGSRGVNPDRDAKGGPVKTLVTVSVTSAEIEQFRKGITG